MKYFFLFFLISVGAHSIAQSPALRFDGDNDYVNLGTEVATNVRTIELWFKLDEAITPDLEVWSSLIIRDNTVSNYDEIVLNFNPSGTSHPGAIRFGVVNTYVDYSDIYSNNNHWNANQWYHIAAVVHPVHGMMMFIDGIKQDNTHPNTIPPPAVDKITTVGCWGELFIRHFDGIIDDVRFSSEAMYSEDFTPPCPEHSYEVSTIGLWHFNEGTGVTANDAGLIYNAEIEGATWDYGPICCEGCCIDISMPQIPIYICTEDSVEVFGNDVTEGIYSDTLTSIHGCDSVIVQEVLLSNNYGFILTPIEHCYGDSVYVFGNYIKGDGIYYDSLSTIHGCDSILQQVVFELPNFNITNDPINICWGDSALVFGSYEQFEGTYYDSLISVSGCDSIIHQDLFNGGLLNIYLDPIEICFGDSALVFDNYEYFEGLYIDNLVSHMGCDSAVYQELNVYEEIDLGLTISGELLISDHPGATYQWINCTTGEILLGEVNQFYAPLDYDAYAVIISDGECSDTSECLKTQQLNLKENEIREMQLYPNPANSSSTINFMDDNQHSVIIISDISGKEIIQTSTNSSSFTFSTMAFSQGIYLVHIIPENEPIKTLKLIIER